MTTRHACSAIAAGVLTCATAAFAQTSQQTPTQAAAQADTQRETSITLVGCIQREADYRRQQASGRGGVAGTGAGLGNEFVLVNASTVTGPTGTAASAGTSTPGATAGTPPPSGADPCATPGTGEAYELTGSRERELERFVGRRVEITGMLKRAETESGTAGTAGTGTGKPTGGFDPMGQDLRLHEVNVTSFREVPVSPPPAPQAEAAAQPVTPAEPESQPVGTAGVQDELPRTASALPLAGLIGLLAFGGALGLRTLRHRR